MNNKRRKEIRDNINMLKIIKERLGNVNDDEEGKDNIKRLKMIKERLENIKDDEEDYFDNMPENLQGSMRGEASEEAIDLLYTAIESLEECIALDADVESLDECIDNLYDIE